MAASSINGQTVLSFYKLFWQSTLSDMPWECILMLIGFLVLTVYYCIFGKGKIRVYFGLQGLILLLIFEPHLVYFLCDKFRIAGRYFRFVWIFPYTVTYGYFVTNLVHRIRPAKRARLAAGILSAVLLVAGAGEVMAATKKTWNGGYPNPGMLRVENVLKIEPDTFQLSEIINRDRGAAPWGDQIRQGVLVTEGAADQEGTTEPACKVLYGHNVFMYLRTYDPTLYSGLGQRDQNRYLGTVCTDDALRDLYQDGDYTNLLNLLVNGQNADTALQFPVSAVQEALAEEEYSYVVISKDKNTAALFSQCGTAVGETDHYQVIRIAS